MRYGNLQKWGQLPLICGLLLAGLLGSALTAEARGVEPAGRAYVYKQVGNRALRLFVLEPERSTPSNPRPAIVWFHGGAWVKGSPSQFNRQSAILARAGIVGIQVEYRPAPAGNTPPIDCIHDAKSAMRWVRSHATELGIDPQRIAAGGGSAGGHLAAFVGMVDGMDDPADDPKLSSKANALILFNPVFDNGPDRGWGYRRVGERYREFSPAHNISADDPPAIILTGRRDQPLTKLVWP